MNKSIALLVFKNLGISDMALKCVNIHTVAYTATVPLEIICHTVLFTVLTVYIYTSYILYIRKYYTMNLEIEGNYIQSTGYSKIANKRH